MCKINGVKLTEMREKAGMSQNALEKKRGVAESTISNYETGRSNPSEEKVDKICFILKINKDDIEIHDVGYSFSDSMGKTYEKYRRAKGFRHYMTSVDFENWINEQRDFDAEMETSEVSNALRYPLTVGNKKYITINPLFVHIPDWQRSTDMVKAKEIEENFNESKFDPIKVFLIDGKLYVADGAHRLAAFIMKNNLLGKAEKLKILVEIIDCKTMCEAVLVFLGQQAGRKPMSVSDMYRAGIEANEEDYINFKMIFDAYNIQISADLNRKENPIGKVTPTMNLLRMAKRRPESLKHAIVMIKELNWCGSTEKNAFTQRNINVLLKMESIHGTETLNLLKKHCSGAAFYESKVFPVKSNAQLFDILESEVNK